MSTAGRFAIIVLDGVGIGEAPDAAAYGDVGSNTLGNVADAVGGLELPNLGALGLGCCRPLRGLPCAVPEAAYGVAVPQSEGKDSTSGHWELMGLILDTPFPTYPDGFPDRVVNAFREATGRGVLCNQPGSGTAVIAEYGPQQASSGDWIVYTSADSVFQVAAHEEVVPLAELYAACEVARREVLVGEHAVSRVIARPFEGPAGRYRRTPNRKDLSVLPPRPTLLDRLAEAGVPRIGVGKVDDLFAGRGIVSRHTATNAEAYALIGDAFDTMDTGLLFANVIEFDQTWGHRNDVGGFHRGLRELDDAIRPIVDRLRGGDIMVITADHGNDPTTVSTDHSREIVPLLVMGPDVAPVPLGERATFSDVGATAAEFFGVDIENGSSMLEELKR